MTVEMDWTEVLEATRLWPPPTPAQQRRAFRHLYRLLNGKSYTGGTKHITTHSNRTDPTRMWADLFWRMACGHGHQGFTVQKRLCDVYSYALRKRWPYALAAKTRAKKPQKTVIERRHDRTLELIKEWERKHKLAGTKLRQLKAKRTYYERELRKRAIRSDAAEFILELREQQEKANE